MLLILAPTPTPHTSAPPPRTPCPLPPPSVVDPTTVPKAVSKERPGSKKSVVYAIRFFPAGDYAWLGPKELVRLTPGAINAFINDPTKRTGDLLEGYRKALDPTAWEEEHEANPPVAKKRKSKSKAKKKGEDDDEDELEADAEDDAEAEDGEEEEEGKKAGKKRKRASSPAPKAKAKPKPAAKAKKGGKAKKSKAAVESEDDAAGEDGEGEDGDGEGDGDGTEERPAKKSKAAKADEDVNAKMESDPEALKVREWRHKLQKTFLSSNKALPKEDEMPAVDTLFTTVEGYGQMNIGYLTFSKIGKVMRHIHLLEPAKVPRDDEFHFRDRAKALVDKWHGILNSNSTKPADGEGGEDAAAEANGMARMDLNGTGGGEGEGDLTVMDVTMDENAS
ncbi:hypothetical protein K438DRAFT_1765472 [Mycena galopus ATCC 62051]|nr:hypothetical protein K438DRAFT_1765472 [Mycena galopus ATCC 62051]